MTDLLTSIDDFRELVGQPRLIQSQANVAKKAVEELVENAMEILNNKMDKVMLQFQFSNTSFMKDIKGPGLLWISSEIAFKNIVIPDKRNEVESDQESLQ